MGKMGAWNAMLEQYTRLPPALKASPSLAGRTVMVVGANTGIGLEAAKHFATMNPARLILGCRNEEKGREAVELVTKETSCKTVELGLIDLANFESVRAFAKTYENDPLDILVMNAALAVRTYETTEDGWEQTSYGEDLKPENAPSMLEKLNERAYCTQKVMETRYPDSKCMYLSLMQFFVARTAEQGARQLLWAALGPDGKDGEHVKYLNGAYVSTLEVKEPSDYVMSKDGYEAHERIWRRDLTCDGVFIEGNPFYPGTPSPNPSSRSAEASASLRQAFHIKRWIKRPGLQ
ncbi:hypothetical protein PHLCEN_2v3231 [Hermanssonia centrifuga]|uniref:Uncharacterized protein n=1 Tax=Hermanssonia centrifuga TaxID=98765 RepID=A0A2R6QXK7_9APHY|nr:hypothetical protein PHLCEN_2v3231 [Hermanssonia centrifuga]